MNMTKFRYFEYQIFARSGLNRFHLFSLKKLNIRTNWPRFGYFGTRVYQYRKYERNQFFGCVRDFDDHIWFLLALTLKLHLNPLAYPTIFLVCLIITGIEGQNNLRSVERNELESKSSLKKRSFLSHITSSPHSSSATRPAKVKWSINLGG